MGHEASAVRRMCEYWKTSHQNAATLDGARPVLSGEPARELRLPPAEFAENTTTVLFVVTYRYLPSLENAALLPGVPSRIGVPINVNMPLLVSKR